MDGDKSAPVKEEPKEESLWDKAPFEYGKVIPRKNLKSIRTNIRIPGIYMKSGVSIWIANV